MSARAGSLHVLIVLAEGVPEDAVEGQARLGQQVLPAPEEYPHAGLAVPALLQHACVHVRVRLHDCVRAWPAPLDRLWRAPGVSCSQQVWVYLASLHP